MPPTKNVTIDVRLKPANVEKILSNGVASGSRALTFNDNKFLVIGRLAREADHAQVTLRNDLPLVVGTLSEMDWGTRISLNSGPELVRRGFAIAGGVIVGMITLASAMAAITGTIYAAAIPVVPLAIFFTVRREARLQESARGEAMEAITRALANTPRMIPAEGVYRTAGNLP
jgi:hypothetical protein